MKKTMLTLLALLCLTGCNVDAKSSEDNKCLLKMSNGFVTDQIGMDSKATDKKACLSLCSDYSQRRIISMKDEVGTLSWKCFYKDKLFHTEKIK